jgi:hypothetical protein
MSTIDGVRWTFSGLNTRETAVILWVGGFLLFAFTRREILSSVGGLFKLVLTSKFLGGLILVAAAYASLAISLLWLVGYWEPRMTKVTVVWFLGFGLVALFNTKNVDAYYFRRLVLHNVGLAVVVEFVVNVHTFPLPVELLLVPAAFLLVGIQVIADNKPEYALVKKVVAWPLGILGFVSLAYSLAYLIGHIDEVVSTSTLKEFLAPVVLTACFVPFLVAVRYLAVWQTMLHMIRFGLRDDEDLYRFARRSIIRACGAHLGKAQLFESEFRGQLWSATSEREVSRVITKFSRDWERGRRTVPDAEVPSA